MWSRDWIPFKKSSTGPFSIMKSSGPEEGEITVGRCQGIQWEVAEEGRDPRNKMAADTVVFLECFTADPGMSTA